MDLRKELPEVFDDFGEARRNNFLKVKELKEQNVPVIGTFCTYFPQELAEAMGAAVVSLCATSDETIAAAEEDLPKNLCPLIKSSYGFAKTDKCPYFYFSDMVIAETTCDGKKKMYEYMAEMKPVYVMHLPNRVDEDSVEVWRKEIIRTKEKMEEIFGVTITEEDIRKAIKVKNRERSAVKKFYSIMKQDPVPITGLEVLKTLNGVTFNLDRKQVPEQMDALIEKIEKEGTKLEKRPRILITGCPMGGVMEKVIKAIEENGAWVVGYENCTGAKEREDNVDETIEDVYQALAEKYLKIGCSCMSPNPNRFDLLSRMIDEYHADAVVDVELTACQPYGVESKRVKRFVTEEKNIPYISIETDYSTSDVGQLTTRLAAFIEML